MQSTFEWRRIAPAHFSARANNARLSAAALWRLKGGEELTSLAADVGYGGTPYIAYHEAFLREAAVALELIVKAAIAQQMRMRQADPSTEGIPATHNVPVLWLQAGLPKLGNDDQYRLLFLNLSSCGRGATLRQNQPKRGLRKNKHLSY